MSNASTNKFFRGDDQPAESGQGQGQGQGRRQYNEDNNFGLDDDNDVSDERQYNSRNNMSGNRGGRRNDMSRGNNNNNNNNNNNDNYSRGGGRYQREDGKNKMEYYSNKSYHQDNADVSLYKNDEASEDLIIPVENFEDFEFDEKLLRGILGYGFATPSPIQQKAIRPFMAGRDVVAQAQSGMGKTATFCLGVLSRINTSKNEPQAIVLAHTRELASQIEMVFRALGGLMPVRFNLSTGGNMVRENISALRAKDKPHVIIGTPGRILDMYSKGAFEMSGIDMLVIDEADEMLAPGFNGNSSTNFQEQVKHIVASIPKEAQIGLYSATMGQDFFHTTKRFLNAPVYVLVKSDELTLEGIKQYFINVEHQSNKFDTLCDIYRALSLNQIIIYCNSRKSAEILSEQLTENNFGVSCIHGKMAPGDREMVMSEFRSGRKTRVLVSTDLLSRGIDVQQVSVVINYDIPNKIESYIHRIGRSGRFGRKGVAINFITNHDISKLQNIEKYYHTCIDEMVDPDHVANILRN